MLNTSYVTKNNINYVEYQIKFIFIFCILHLLEIVKSRVGIKKIMGFEL